jgi:hypothetical protein
MRFVRATVAGGALALVALVLYSIAFLCQLVIGEAFWGFSQAIRQRDDPTRFWKRIGAQIVSVAAGAFVLGFVCALHEQ